VPSLATNQVSIRPVAACANITRTLGQAIRNKVGTIGPCSSTRVRGLSSTTATFATFASLGATLSAGLIAVTLISRSSCASGLSRYRATDADQSRLADDR